MLSNNAPEPITDDDDTIRRALEHAEIAPLLTALAYTTGDLSLLRPEFRIDTALSLMPGFALPEELTTAVGEVAFDVLVRLRDEGLPPRPSFGPDELRRLIDFAVGGDEVVDEYIPLFQEELGIDDVDLRAPDWQLGDVAPDRELRVAIIGAGMSGLLAAYRLHQAGVPFVVLEKNDDVGGTWLENTYPGCRVDVPNHFYSYSFAQRTEWEQYFSTQPVLLDYFRDFADRGDLRRHIRFGVEVTAAEWDDERAVWVLQLVDHDGNEETLDANALVSAVGQLNRPLFPDIPGRDTFAGPSFHSAEWDHRVELAGKRVGVIGTGASAAQFIPVIAEQVGELLVFQRTPNWLAPTPEYYRDVPPEVTWLFRHVPSYSHWYRFWLFWRNAEGMLPLVKVDPDWPVGGESVGPMNEMLRQFLVAYLEEQFADRPDLIDKVVPHYAPAAKRMIRDDGIWARTLTRDNVGLITDGIVEITPKGVVTDDGVEHEVDVLVYGTGFQASRFLTPMKVVGRGGVDLHDHWHGDARAYLGVVVPGFPNFFVLYGPNTNIVINGSIIFFSECEVRYLVDCLRLLLEGGHASLDCRPEVHDAFNDEIDAGNLGMAWGVATVHSWYRNETGRSAQNWPFTLLDYWQRTRHADPADYDLR